MIPKQLILTFFLRKKTHCGSPFFADTKFSYAGQNRSTNKSKIYLHGLGSRLRWPFPPACRGKDRLMDFVRICDGLFPLPVEEKAVSWTLLPLCDCLFPLREKEKASFRFPRRHPREASRGPRKWPGSSRAKKLSILTLFAS